MPPLDSGLLEEAMEARERCADLQQQLAQQKADFCRAVRRLHASGASLREIAAALDLSHQRIHQLVGSGGAQSWIARLTRASARPRGRGPSPSCSFCGATQVETERMVAGPGVWICERCIDSATRATSDGESAAEGEGTRFTLVGPDEQGTRCDFCGRGPRRPERILRGGRPAHTVCANCLRLCNEILAGSP